MYSRQFYDLFSFLVPKPDMDKYVFMKAKEDVLGVLVDEDADANR